MGLVSRNYFIADGDSGAATAQNLDVVVPAGEEPVLQYLYVEASDGSSVAWLLQRPSGTTVLQGYSPMFIDFGLDGFVVPGTAGDDLRLAISAASSGISTRGWLVGNNRVVL